MKKLSPMCSCSRRTVLAGMTMVATTVVTAFATRAHAAPDKKHKEFVAAAFLMKAKAVKAGDQAYGAVVVKKDRIIGFGPSRVVLNKDPTAHAEREAMREAQARLGNNYLSECVMYSTSRPCSACEAFARETKLSRMYYGPDATDAGAPRSSL